MGVTRTNRAVARATGASCPNWEVICMSSTWSAPPRAAVVLDVPTEGARGRELAELVPDHRLGHEDRDVLAAVVHGHRVPEHVGDDRRATRPGADHVLGALFVLSVHLLEQGVADDRAFFRAPAAPDQGITGLALARTALRLALRVHRVTSTGGLALTTTVRVVDRVHGDTADGRALSLPAHPRGLAPVDVGLLGVAHLADGRAAAHVDVADLARGHAQLSQPTLTGDQLDAG